MARRSLFDFVGLKAKLPLCIIFKTNIILKAGAFILTERRQEPYAQRAVRSVTPRRAGGAEIANVAAKTGMTRVGRWMSEAEYSAMKSSGTVVEGAGGQTFVTQGGSHLYASAAKGSVYVEFDVSTNSLLQGGKEGWFKMLGPNASKSQLFMLNKQGGQLLPTFQNLSPILQIK